MTHLVLGAAGQDGIIACQLLRARDVEFFAGVRQMPTAGHALLRTVPDERILQVDVTDPAAVESVLRRVRPTRVLNLTGMSQVGESWAQPERYLEANLFGTLNVLRGVLGAGLVDSTRVYQASSSEVFGRPRVVPQDERTPLAPITPYGVSKAGAHQFAHMFRERFGVWVTIGTLFNHESIHRPESFVVRHVTASVARIKAGRQHVLRIGDLRSQRDWGYAPDYVEGMLRMLEFPEPEDFILATGTLRSVRELVEGAFAAAGIADWEDRVEIDPQRMRPTEPQRLVGDPSRARSLLGWDHSRTFQQMLEELVDFDLALQGSGGSSPVGPSRSAHEHERRQVPTVEGGL